jgi:hypothetical protein
LIEWNSLADGASLWSIKVLVDCACWQLTICSLLCSRYAFFAYNPL